MCARHVIDLGGGSPLRTRQGEPLARRQGCRSQGRIRRKSRQSVGPTNRNLIRGGDAGQGGKEHQSPIRELLRRGRGRRLDRVIGELTLKLRGWGNYFKLAEVKKVFEDLDGWIRRKLRNILWRQWKKPQTRYRELKSRGISEDLARRTAHSGRGPWFASGTQGMNFAFPKKFFDDLGSMPLLTKMAKMGHLAKLPLLADASGGGLFRRCVPSSSSTHHREAIRTSL